MNIEYAVSLWNYNHYRQNISLERAINGIKEAGYGVEIWGSWGNEKDLFDEVGRKRLKACVEGMKVSLHTAKPDDFSGHKKQIDAAAEIGAGVVVNHTVDFASKTGGLDPGLAREAVAYSREKGVRLALENGQLSFLSEALDRVEELGICLDVGHIYPSSSMKDYLDVLGPHIIHLHIQDILPEAESGIEGAAKDHFLPGTGGIPEQDWELLFSVLERHDFAGTAVFEIRPRNPLQIAFLGKKFVAQYT